MFLQKKLILAVLLSAVALLPLGAVAQQQRNFVSFSGGYSLPVGAFASQNFGDPKAGLAGSGVYAQLSYERRLADHFGLRLTGSLNINQTDAQPLIDEYSVLLPKPDSYSWQKETSTWQLGALLLGPSGYLPLGKVELEGHVQAGVVLAESPSVSLFGISAADSPDVEGTVTQATTAAFGFGAGASVRFRLTDRLRLQLHRRRHRRRYAVEGRDHLSPVRKLCFARNHQPQSVRDGGECGGGGSFWVLEE